MIMKLSMRKGFGFGLTSGIITTLGLIVGLNSTTHSTLVIIGGIIIIAIADALSDSLGMHISEEAENKYSVKEIWESTISTFISKFIFALTLISIFSYYVAKRERIKPHKVILEHLTIAIIVIILTNFVGNIVSIIFK